MREIDPHDTDRAQAYDLWLNAPMPMVTLIKKINVGKTIKYGRAKGLKFNMLMLWAIGKAASKIKEFYRLPIGNKLIEYEKLAVCAIIENRQGNINSCDIPFSEKIDIFSRSYDELTSKTRSDCIDNSLTDYMVIGTSAMIQTELAGVCGMHSGIYNNPMLFWGHWHKSLFGVELSVSFQFHHAQMDGKHGATFLESLQKYLITPGKG